MAGLERYDREGTLSIGGVSMSRPAWAIIADQNGAGGLFQLLTTVSLKGQNRPVPAVAGTIPYRRRLSESAYTFRLLVTGDVDLNGNDNADTVQGLIANLDYLYDNVIDPPATNNSLRAAVWTAPNAVTRTADIQVLSCSQTQYSFDPNTNHSLWIGTLGILVPAGRFV